MNNGNVEFHDTAGGGYYCKVCDWYIHPDMIHQHNDHNHGRRGYPLPHNQQQATIQPLKPQQVVGQPVLPTKENNE